MLPVRVVLEDLACDPVVLGIMFFAALPRVGEVVEMDVGAGLQLLAVTMVSHQPNASPMQSTVRIGITPLPDIFEGKVIDRAGYLAA